MHQSTNQGFHFNQNLCTGCHACVVACQIENGGELLVPWREISTFNSFQHPGLPVFHYSLACNHCEDAPCMNSCPALAYTHDEGLNTIVHHANRCIGCKYCTWACPYDAPKYVQTSGVIEKCTSCQHRLEAGQKPACANLCPTGALDYKAIGRKIQSRIPGFTEIGIGPGIEITQLRSRTAPRSVLHLERDEKKQFEALELKVDSTINLSKEWVLILFTLLVPLLTASMAAASLGWMQLSPRVFLPAGIAGLILSSIHLGKKFRAWRSVLNVKNSWLSREILGYALFLGSAGLWFLLPEYRMIGYISALIGFATSYSIDKVYLHFEKSTALDVQSNNVFLTSMLLASLLIYNEQFAGLILAIKFLLYLYRKIYFLLHQQKLNYILTGLRITAGFILPVWIWFSMDSDPTWIFALILSGELIDRIEFYMEGEIISPKRQIGKDLIHTANS